MRRTPLLAVFLTVVIDLLGFGLILPLLPLYADAYGASKLLVGLLFASFSAMQFVFAPIWGRISDRVGRRPVILLGLAGSVVSYAAFAFAETTPWPLVVLFASRIAAGVFGGTVTTAFAYIADVTSESERGRGMALIGAAFGIGFTIGPALGGLGHAYLGSLAPGLIAAAFSAIALLFAWFRLPEPARHAPARETSWLRMGALARACRIPGVGRMLLVGFVATSAFALFESTLALLAHERFENWGPRANGWLFSYLGFWLVVAQGWFVRRHMQRVGEHRFAIVGCGLLAVGLVAIGYAPSPWLLAAVAPIAVFGSAMVTPSIASLISLATSADVQGEILGVNQSAQALARIVGPVAGNAMLGVSLLLPYWGAGGVVVLALVIALGLRNAPTAPAADRPAT